jgi:hypothetical protein
MRTAWHQRTSLSLFLFPGSNAVVDSSLTASSQWVVIQLLLQLLGTVPGVCKPLCCGWEAMLLYQTEFMPVAPNCSWGSYVDVPWE